MNMFDEARAMSGTLLLCKIKVGDESSQLEVLTNTISILNWQFTG